MSPSFFTRSVSKRSLRSLSRATGTISRSANSRAVSRISRCSSVSSKSIIGRGPYRRLRMGVELPDPPGDGRMSIRATKPALDEEESLRQHVEHFLVAAHELPSLDVGERIDVVERITAFLAEILLPHAEIERRVLYPQAALLLHERDDSAAVAHDAEALRVLLAQLAHADAADAGAIQEVLYAMYTLLSAHFWREEALLVKLAGLPDDAIWAAVNPPTAMGDGAVAAGAARARPAR